MIVTANILLFISVKWVFLNTVNPVKKLSLSYCHELNRNQDARCKSLPMVTNDCAMDRYHDL